MAAFTAIAAGVGLAITAGTTAKSFSDASKQKRLQKEAEADAEKAMAEARKKLEINYFDALAIKKEPYELQRDALLSQGALGVQAGVEGDTRGAAATIGRVQMAQTQAQEGVRTDMGKEMDAIEMKQLTEESRLRDAGVALDLAEAEGSQKAAAQAYEAKNAATAQGIEGLGNVVQQSIALAPLYSRNTAKEQKAISGMSLNEAERKDFGMVPASDIATKYNMGADMQSHLKFEEIGKMSKEDYRTFFNTLSPYQQKLLKNNKQYTDNYFKL
jgi:hypothetical protein